MRFPPVRLAGCSSGSDTPDRTDDELSIACQQYIGKFEPAFKDCPIKVLHQNKIAAFLDQHVALALEAQMKVFPHLRTHREWGSEIESLGALKASARRNAFIEQNRTELRQPTATHLCVWGEPGIGKTRLLYEATGVDDLSPSVAYFGSPKRWNKVELSMNWSETSRKARLSL